MQPGETGAETVRAFNEVACRFLRQVNTELSGQRIDVYGRRPSSKRTERPDFSLKAREEWRLACEQACPSRKFLDLAALRSLQAPFESLLLLFRGSEVLAANVRSKDLCGVVLEVSE